MQRRLHVFSLVILMSIALALPAHAQLNSDDNLPSDTDLSADLFSPPPVAVAPPPLPVYTVPPPPMEEYAWQPGYWRWDGYGYFWVPGTWVMAPAVGLLWTPGYWDWNGYAYEWHEGYWAEHVGYYGGINYGGGYDGTRFYGGSWNRGRYECNPAILRALALSSNYVGFVSFHGGPGGLRTRPTPQQLMAEHERHYEMTREQMTHTQLAAHHPEFSTAHNHGRPPVAASVRAGDFASQVVVAERAGPKNPEAVAHNALVREHPEIVNGAALPANRQQPGVTGAGRPNTLSVPIPVETQPETVRPQHYYQPREPHVEVSPVVMEPVVQPQSLQQPLQQQPVQQQPRVRMPRTGPMTVAAPVSQPVVAQEPLPAARIAAPILVTPAKEVAQPRGVEPTMQQQPARVTRQVMQPVQQPQHIVQPLQQPMHQQAAPAPQQILNRGSVPQTPVREQGLHPQGQHHEAVKGTDNSDPHHAMDNH